MTGSTLIIELHSWRRPQMFGGLFGRVYCMGFVSITYAPVLLSDWLKERIDALKSVVGGSRGFVEMAAWDESRVERINEPKSPHVPWNGRILHK